MNKTNENPPSFENGFSLCGDYKKNFSLILYRNLNSYENLELSNQVAGSRRQSINSRTTG